MIRSPIQQNMKRINKAALLLAFIFLFSILFIACGQEDEDSLTESDSLQNDVVESDAEVTDELGTDETEDESGAVNNKPEDTEKNEEESEKGIFEYPLSDSPSLGDNVDFNF